jgi:hypothetical protein
MGQAQGLPPLRKIVVATEKVCLSFAAVSEGFLIKLFNLLPILLITAN